MATALKLKSDIKKLKAAISSKATPKSFLPKLKSQLEKAEKELASVNAGKATKTSTTKGTEKTLSALEKLIQKKKYGVYQGAGVDLKKDAGEGALATGRRVSKGLKANQFGSKGENKGNVYYEYRPNRLDVKQPKKAQKYPKLEKGGYANGGQVKVGDIITANTGVKVKVVEYDPKFGGRIKGTRMDEYGDGKVSQWMPLKKFKYEEGGMMAKGGILSDAFKLGDKIAAIQFWDNSLVVDNPTSGRAVISLETGKRKEGGMMAYGGELHKSEE